METETSFEVDVYKPIFVVGYPRGGLTILTNMLKQNEKIYTVGGRGYNLNDEMHTTYKDVLPSRLRVPKLWRHIYFAVANKETGDVKKIPDTVELRRVFNPTDPSDTVISTTLKTTNEIIGYTSWMMGWRENIIENHLTEKQVADRERDDFLKIFKIIYTIHGGPKMRFLDKSQTYLTKTRYLQEILKPEDVYFIFVMMNPFNLCYKPFRQNVFGYVKRPPQEILINEACEHVSNTYKCWNLDAKKLKHHKIVRYEDLILNTKRTLKGICKFLDLNFQEKMLPHPPKRDKFYPLDKKRIGRTHARYSHPKLDNIIEQYCFDILEDLNYSRYKR